MTHRLRAALPSDAADCVLMRGKTRQNAVSPERLAELGITPASWAAQIASGQLPGHVCHDGQGRLIGYCFGDRDSGEVVVLALLPDCEGRGLGRSLLQAVMQELRPLHPRRLFLGCSSDPESRSYGFYRHLGWRSTGTRDGHGDEVLEYLFDAHAEPEPLTEPAVLRFLQHFEALAAQKDFGQIEALIHEQAFFRFNDGDFLGRAAVKQAFEATWQSGHGVENERFYLSDIVVLSTDRASASVTYNYHWQGLHEGRQLHIQGRGSRVLVRGPDGRLQIIHEHLSRLPKPAESVKP